MSAVLYDVRMATMLKVIIFWFKYISGVGSYLLVTGQLI